MQCRHCAADLTRLFVDLGSAPPSNAYLTEEALHGPEVWFPLRVMVCEACWLVQTEDYAQAHLLFNDQYHYFSSFSRSWLSHCERYVIDMVDRFGLNATSHVVEVAANDGYLLQYVQARGIPCTGVEPTTSTASAARAKGLVIEEEFFGVALAKVLLALNKQADLMVAINVLAHVPDINDFVSGFARLLKPCGVATFEFPHLLKLIEKSEFDTIYHEHFSYLSFTVLQRIFAANGLNVFDVEEHSTHGGSLRIFAQRQDTGNKVCHPRVEELLRRELAQGVKTVDFYTGFQAKTDAVKNGFVAFLLEAKRQGKRVMAYGAAAKGNTLLNYAGVRGDLLSCVVDLNPAKQGNYLPGSRIPIVSEGVIDQIKPDYIVIFPWNLKEEIMTQLQDVRAWGGQFVLAVPYLQIL